MYLAISNKGLVEAGALSLMGASVKSEGAVGKFGSGFKYALATLIRHGLEVRIFSGDREIPIETRPETFRDRQFDVLWIDGIRTSITTETGKEWAIRDAIREVWSNARDEGSPLHYVTDSIRPIPDHSIVAIELSGDVRRMVDNWHLFFIEDLPEVFKCVWGRIVEQQVPNFFRRGVWICEDRQLSPIFSYDFDDIDLPESRKVNSHTAVYHVFYMLCQCSSADVWRKLWENRSTKYGEWHALSMYNIDGKGKNAALRAFLENWDFFGQEKFRDRIKTQGERVLWVDDSFSIVCRRLGVPNIADKMDHSEDFEILPWPIGYEERLVPTLSRLAAVGVDMKRFPIALCRFYDAEKAEKHIAIAHKGKCYVTEQAFEMEPRMLMKALVEEWTHLEHNVHDCTIPQQHVYLDLIVSLINQLEKK